MSILGAFIWGGQTFLEREIVMHNYTHYTFLPKCVEFREGGKPEYPDKIPQSAGEISYDNSTHMRRTSCPRLGIAIFR